MDTQKRLHENISALADGELADSERELALAALDTAEGQAAWRAYHLAGDVLRDQAGGALSDGFGASLAARLAAEPVYMAGAAPAERAGDPSAPAPDQAESPADVILP
ncbi:sigma-E factor negative regulatory protein [Duganella sp. HH105]|uniref:sigma-E factor negative regulatory protein n=1 Tax=Duganella sp. HH105 TaxID=1781067 RepID=UPI000877BBEE|nr:RseA family anti-sigma factor [Duganella sp. HH105]OEZ55885.1 anti-RNA polymerase sigma factor SigE [Duganella sp. HH105]